MAKFFGNLNAVLGVGLALAVALMAVFHADSLTLQVVLRWLHVFFGVLWIGLLYYFNFVQTPVMPTVPAELKPGVSKYIAPKALFYFRWAAALTVLLGLCLAYANAYLVEADDAAKAAAAKTAGIASRLNVLLSIPMLYAMASFQSLPR